MDERIGTVIDRYRLERVIGQGGMAVVYRARHTDLDTLHAVKILLHRSGSISDRLLQEGRIQARLRHPNIVSVTDVVRANGELALVMDYIDGLPLGTLASHLHLTPGQIHSLATGLFAGVRAAHDLGLVHRDLKPENILVELTSTSAIPRVTDFGLAKALRDELRVGRSTRTGSSMGTPQYMAPEQYRDSSTVDIRADVYSLGAILYELVTGTPLFPDADLPVVLARSQLGDWKKIPEVAPWAPEAWVNAIHSALSLDPKARPQDMTAFEALWGPLEIPEPVWPADVIQALIDLRDVRALEPIPEPYETPLPSARVMPGSGAPGSVLTGGSTRTVPDRSDGGMRDGSSLSDSRPSSSSLVRFGGIAVGLGGITFAGGALLGVALLSILVWTRASDTASAAQAPVVVEGGTPAVDWVPADESSLAPGRSERSASGRPVLAAPAPPTPVAPAPSPVPAPDGSADAGSADAGSPDGPTRAVITRDPSLATVTLPGLSGYLIGSDLQRRSLDAAPPGTYDVFVFFDIQVPSLATRVTVEAGENRRLKCDSVSRMCR
ncbi:MAG: serine/threonine-protein kinase [Myxococcota bacterium]